MYLGLLVYSIQQSLANDPTASQRYREQKLKVTVIETKERTKRSGLKRTCYTF